MGHDGLARDGPGYAHQARAMGANAGARKRPRLDGRLLQHSASLQVGAAGREGLESKTEYRKWKIEIRNLNEFLFPTSLAGLSVSDYHMCHRTLRWSSLSS